ncbi:hypothetical protein CFP56_019291, partial [Quercus suber]
ISNCADINPRPSYATDTDEFVIPSLEIGDLDRSKTDASEVEASKPPSPKVICILKSVFFELLRAKREENIYLGPHGAPSSQSKQQKPNSAGRKQRLKLKLKEADERTSGKGRENKELVGGGKATGNMAKGCTKDWLDPHCHESQFE